MLIYPAPSLDDGQYEIEFFVHGVRHMHKDVETWCARLEKATLLPMLDVKNPFDQHAIALRPEDTTLILGYVPVFYAPDIHSILLDKEVRDSAKFSIVRCNLDAPSQLRLLCRFTSRLPVNFKSMQADEQIPLLPELA